MMPSLMLIFNLSPVAVIWSGGQLVDEGRHADRRPDGVLAYIMQILFAVMMAVMR